MAAWRERVARTILLVSCVTCIQGEIVQSNYTGNLQVDIDGTLFQLQVSPERLDGLLMNHNAQVSVTVTEVWASAHPGRDRGGVAPTHPAGLHLKVLPESDDIVTVEGPPTFLLQANASSNGTAFSVKGLYIGRTRLFFYTDSPGQVIADSRIGLPWMDSRPGKNSSATPASHDSNTLHRPTESYGSLETSSHVETRVNTTGPVYMGSEIARPGGAEVDSVVGERWHRLDYEYHVSVVREERIVDHIFLGVILLIILLANVGMGCKIDLEIVKEVLKRPVPPAIGLVCQYLLMPGIAFSLITLLKLDGGQALGMFAVGCSPGGGASNMYAYLLDGDVSLSVTMTLISTIAALGMIPLWLFTIGRLILNEQAAGVHIPFSNIGYTLLGILIPVLIGILIQRYRPRWSKKIRATLRPVFIFFLVFIFTFGVYTNLYVFRLFTPRMILAGCLLPYVGFLLGGIAAFLCRQSWSRVKTIAVETGIQNTGIAFLLITFSLPQPEADLALVSPIVVATFTPIPLMIAITVIEVRKRCFKEVKQPFHTVTTEERLVEQGSPDQQDLPNGLPKQNGHNVSDSEGC